MSDAAAPATDYSAYDAGAQAPETDAAPPNQTEIQPNPAQEPSEPEGRICDICNHTNLHGERFCEECGRML
jgi:hypothetical protein